MKPLSPKDVDLILQQLEVLTSSLKEKADLLTFYTFFAFIDRLAQSKKPQLELHAVERFIVLLEDICGIKSESFPDVGFSYRSLRDIADVISSEVNTIATHYNFLRPQVVKLRRSLSEQLRLVLKENGKENVDQWVSAINNSSYNNFEITSEFWIKQFDSSLLAFRENKSLDTLDPLMACLPLWLESFRLYSASKIIKFLNDYLDLSDEFIDIIRQTANSNLERLPILDASALEQEIRLRDESKINLLKQSIAEIIIAKDLPKDQKAKLKERKASLNEELSSLLKQQKLEVEEKLNENKKLRNKLIAVEKKTGSYRQNVAFRLEREVIRALDLLISTYYLTRDKDPVWSNAKKQMRKFFLSTENLTS